MPQFNKKAIIELQEKICSKFSQPTTEEATKQWYVMPLLVALGYDMRISERIGKKPMHGPRR